MSRAKTWKKIVISALLLVVLFFILGFVYVFIGDGSSSKLTQVKAINVHYATVKPPPKPSPNTPVGVALEALDSPVAPGSNTSMIITTTPTAKCDITVSYDGRKSTDSGLVPKTADAYGSITWSWTVPQNTPSGNWPIYVACYFHTKWAQLDETLDVSNSAQ